MQSMSWRQGPADTLTTKGPLDIEEVESVQSTLIEGPHDRENHVTCLHMSHLSFKHAQWSRLRCCDETTESGLNAATPSGLGTQRFV